MTRSVLAAPQLLALDPALADGTDGTDGKEAPETTHACITRLGGTGVAARAITHNMAARPEGGLVEQFKVSRSGKRSNELLAVIAKPLCDADLARRAAWVALTQFEVKMRS